MDRSQIRHIAELAELTLSEEEEARLTEELGRIVAYCEELDAIDTKDVPPTTNVSSGSSAEPAGATPALRSDDPEPSLDHQQALAGAPRAAHGGFSVPVFVE